MMNSSSLPNEKTSIQARRRKHATDKCRPDTPMRIEHEYARCGAWAYIAGLDVHHARIFGRCQTKNGIDPFDRLVEQVMTRPPYNDARRGFWIVDNCSAHRGVRAVERLRNRYSQLTLVHAPIHASWLNQIEIYFSIVQRKVLTPNDFPNLNSVAERLLNFQYYWEDTAKPFEWKFSRKDLSGWRRSAIPRRMAVILARRGRYRRGLCPPPHGLKGRELLQYGWLILPLQQRLMAMPRKLASQ